MNHNATLMIGIVIGFLVGSILVGIVTDYDLPDFTKARVSGVKQLRNGMCEYTVKHTIAPGSRHVGNAEFKYYCGLEIGHRIETVSNGAGL